MNAHFLLLERAHAALSHLTQRYVFVGGATVSLHLDDPAAGPARATKDVDLVVEVAGYADYSAIEAQLRHAGFLQDLSTDHSPICRWMKGELLIDVLPTDPEILGFTSSRWFQKGFDQAKTFKLPTGTVIEAFGPIYLMAAKIDAFSDRGDDDWLASQDIEDLSTILDGRKSIFEELAADDEVAIFVRGWLRQWGEELSELIAGHVGSYDRAEYLVKRL